MALYSLKLADEEKRKLLYLKLVVEEKANKSINVLKDYTLIKDLVSYALDSKIPEIRKALREFGIIMSKDTSAFLRTLGVDVDRLDLISYTDARRRLESHHTESKGRKGNGILRRVLRDFIKKSA